MESKHVGANLSVSANKETQVKQSFSKWPRKCKNSSTRNVMQMLTLR